VGKNRKKTTKIPEKRKATENKSISKKRDVQWMAISEEKDGGEATNEHKLR